MWYSKKKSTPETRLDKVFSEYIRLKKSKNKVCRCITCGKLADWKEMDAGHYISRSVKSLRYDERNVWPQCRACNRFHQGQADEYALFLIKTYGQDILQELNKQKYIIKPYNELEIKALIEYYKKEIKKLLTIYYKNRDYQKKIALIRNNINKSCYS